MTRTFDDALAKMTSSIQLLFDNEQSKDVYQQEAVQIFSAAWELGRMSSRRFSNSQLKQLKHVAQETAVAVESCFNRLSPFYEDLSDDLEKNWRMTEWGYLDRDWWEPICVGWSSGHFLRELYEGTGALDDWHCFLTPDEMDDMLRWHGEEDGCLTDEQIPDGIPPTHWWWWYPREPPPNGSLTCASDGSS